MNHFHLWCNVPPAAARQFCEIAQECLSDMHQRELIEGYSLTRRKFAVAPPDLGEFHIMVDFATVDQMNRALEFVEGDDEVMAQQRAALEPLVRDVQFSMYRDYPERITRKRTVEPSEHRA
jgi:hypothetical protein